MGLSSFFNYSRISLWYRSLGGCAQIALQTHMWFIHNIQTNASTYLVANTSKAVKDRILHMARNFPKRVLQPLVIDALYADAQTWSRGREPDQLSVRLVELVGLSLKYLLPSLSNSFLGKDRFGTRCGYLWNCQRDACYITKMAHRHYEHQESLHSLRINYERYKR